MSALFEDLIEAAEEAAAFMRGEETGAVVTHAPDPKEIRAKANLTQEQMAPLLGMSLSGYRKLEQGQRQVSGPTSVLLRVLATNPRAVIDAIGPG